MKFEVEKTHEPILSGTSSEYQVEVCHGGWGGQLADGMLVSVIVRTVKRIGAGPDHWEAAETIFLSLDKDAAKWLADALAKVLSGAEVGVRRTFS